MKPTEMPAFRPTANFIWNIFQNSGKRHLIITGSRGVGKSTLLNELSLDSTDKLLSYVNPRDSVWLSSSKNNTSALIGQFNGVSMSVVPDGFNLYGASALHSMRTSNNTYVIIDELGYLEQDCCTYLDELYSIFDTKRVICAARKESINYISKLMSRKDVFVVDLDMHFDTIGCVIMASGLGTRFGGNKIMADFGGRNMLEIVLDNTTNFFGRRIVVTRSEEVNDYCLTRDIPVIMHALPNRNDTVRLGIEAIAEGLGGIMFCPCDQPLLSRDTLAKMLITFANTSGIVRPTNSNPVIFSSQYFDELLNLPSGKGGSEVIKCHPNDIVEISVDNPLELCDVDTPEDLARLLHKM